MDGDDVAFDALFWAPYMPWRRNDDQRAPSEPCSMKNFFRTHKRTMDFSDPKLVRILRHCIPIQYKSALAPHILSPGPRLVMDGRPWESLNEWEFPVLPTLGKYKSLQLMQAVQFAVAHTAEHHRSISVPETLIALLRDLVAYARSIWVTFDISEEDLARLCRCLSEFCNEDERYMLQPNFYEAMESINAYSRGTMLSHGFAHLILPEDPVFASHSAVSGRTAKDLIEYAKDTVEVLLLASEDAADVASMCGTFSQEVNDIQQLFHGNWIDFDNFISDLRDIFRELSPHTCAVDIWK
eukprot:IDg2314t1